MTRPFASPFLRADDAATPIHTFTPSSWELADLPGPVLTFARSQGFTGAAGQTVLMPNAEGHLGNVLFGLGDGGDTLAPAGLASGLPAGSYRLATDPAPLSRAQFAAAWADGAYRFDAYLSDRAEPPRLVIPDGLDPAATERLAKAEHLLRDLVNTPAEDMGPAGLQAAVSALAETHGARLETVMGDALLDENYPMIHAVGRAAAQPPRLMRLSWGDPSKPHLALVGKGVAFDSGGLNLKPGDGMRHMKKDMGGAAHAIALADLVMAADLPVFLTLSVPAVENAISEASFRPGDVLRSRKGLSVEIDNTDAEGRLILADALTRVCEDAPDLVIDFATLTGAARVALGPDLAPYYTERDDLAVALEAGAQSSGDPVWRLPLWMAYRRMLKSGVADLANAGGRMAGSITAAIFLKHFVDTRDWIHFDIWAWRTARYGRPAGGAACGLRATWALLQARYTR